MAMKLGCLEQNWGPVPPRLSRELPLTNSLEIQATLKINAKVFG